MILLSKLLPIFIFPIGLTVELILGGGICHALGRRKPGQTLLVLAALVLLFFSSGPVQRKLVTSLERAYMPVNESVVKADAIVALGGAGRPKTFPRNHVEFNESGERIFHAIRLFKAGAAPYIITTGGGIDFMLNGQKEGDDMKELMVEFGAPADRIISESRSQNTHDNATMVMEIMRQRKLGTTILLVTSAMHMKRSVATFKRAGFTVIPAPADYLVEDSGTALWYSLLPTASNLTDSTAAIREYIGIATYKLLGWL